MPKTRGLTPKQARFVEEYLVDLNATQAATRAGYSAKNADKIGPQLLGKTSVTHAIQAKMDVRSARLDITADHVLQELARLGFSDVTHYAFDEHDNVVLSEQAPSYAMRAVAGIKRKRRFIPQRDGPPIEEREVEFRLWDKNVALTNLGKHLKLFVERQEITGPNGGPIELMPVRERIAARLAEMAERQHGYDERHAIPSSTTRELAGTGAADSSA